MKHLILLLFSVAAVSAADIRAWVVHTDRAACERMQWLPGAVPVSLCLENVTVYVSGPENLRGFDIVIEYSDRGGIHSRSQYVRATNGTAAVLFPVPGDIMLLRVLVEPQIQADGAAVVWERPR